MWRANHNSVHFVPKEAQTVTAILEQHFSVDPEKQRALFSLGAIYLNKKRLLKDAKINAKDHLQIYLNPRRYPANEINWSSVVVGEETNFIIINKPRGIPVHSTDDNLTENVLYQLRKILDQELWVTHRLDNPVSGLMVLAKTSKYQAEFNRLLSERKVSKFYRALVEREPKLGVLKHFMSPEEKTPRKLSEEPKENWQECILEILKVEPWKDLEGKKFWEVEIELHTGRTHQIRAQISKVGSPILGDKMYRGRNRAGFTRSLLALHSSRLVWVDSTGKHQFEIDPSFKLK